MAAALAIMETLRPDLIITDTQMPEMDGLALCAHLKADTTLAHIPIIMSAATNKPLARGCGASAFLDKPFQPSTILATVTGALARPA